MTVISAVEGWKPLCMFAKQIPQQIDNYIIITAHAPQEGIRYHGFVGCTRVLHYVKIPKFRLEIE